MRVPYSERTAETAKKLSNEQLDTELEWALPIGSARNELHTLQWIVALASRKIEQLVVSKGE